MQINLDVLASRCNVIILTFAGVNSSRRRRRYLEVYYYNKLPEKKMMKHIIRHINFLFRNGYGSEGDEGFQTVCAYIGTT